MADRVIMLEVPFDQKDEAKALGARWDREAQSWFLPPGRDPAPFARWIPRPVRTDGPSIPARLLGQANRCYRCTAKGVALTGILVSPRYSLDPSGFISFDYVARTLAALVNDTPLAERFFIGRIRMRSSQAHPGGYVASACRHCDALWGSFPLQEAVTEYLADGGSYERLTIAELAFPVAGLPDLRSAWADVDEDAYEDGVDEPERHDDLTVLFPAAPATAASVAPRAAVDPHPGDRSATVAERHWRRRPWRRTEGRG